MDELEIEGRRYISTRRAAKEHKYTSDYVGQLIRGGKVVGKKVGRSWYVSEESLNTYLKGEQPAPTPVAKVVVPVAVEVMPVEPIAIEEIRKEEPVVVAPIEKIIEEIEEPIVVTEAKEVAEEKIFEPVIVRKEHLEEHHIPIRTPAHTAPTSTGLRYVADDEPAIPEIKKKSAVTVAPRMPVRRVVEEEVTEEQETEEVEIIPRKRTPLAAIAGVFAVGVIAFVATAALSATLNTRIVVEEGQDANVGFTFQ